MKVFFSRFFLLCTFSLLLAACGLSEKDKLAEEERNRQEAKAKLQSLLDERNRRVESENARVLAEQSRLEALAAEAAKPKYDPKRLAFAANTKQWAPCEVPDLGIQAWLRTTWKDGKIYMRLALIGQTQALELFTNQWRQFRIKLSDEFGRPHNQYVVMPNQLKMSSSSINGLPTMEFESSVEMPLEVYEGCKNWNFEWDG